MSALPHNVWVTVGHTCCTYSSGGTCRFVAASYRSKLSAARFMLSAVRCCTCASTCKHAGTKVAQYFVSDYV